MDDTPSHDVIPPQPEPFVTAKPGPEGKPLAYEETPILGSQEASQENPNLKSQSPNEDWLKPQQPLENHASNPTPEPAQPIPPYTPPTPSSTPPMGGPSYTTAIPPKPSKRRGSCLSTIGTIMLFIVLFVAGIALSSVLRQFVPNGLPSFGGSANVTATPTPSEGDLIPTTTPRAGSGTTAGWKSYTVMNGLTRTAVPDISFMLPPDVLSPICDGSNCASQGTYLPGGTRFTIAARGPGQVLRDYRGAQVSDALGQLFTVTQTTKLGNTAVNFAGDFTGRTISGYAFAKMHGYMIAIDDTHSIEINHFTPSGITADFATDDVLFEKIVGTLVLPTSGTKGAVLTTPTPTLAPATPATTSGN